MTRCLLPLRASVIAIALMVAPTAHAGLVDFTYDMSSGDVFLRIDAGIGLIQAPMYFGDAAGATFNLAPFADPPNISAVNTVDINFLGGRLVALGPTPVAGSVIETHGATVFVGNLTGPTPTSFDCPAAECSVALGGGVVTDEWVDITSQTSFLVIGSASSPAAPEPSALALLGLALVALAARRA